MHAGAALTAGMGVARAMAQALGPSRLREYDVPREDLETLSEAIAERAPAKANPRPAPPDAIRDLLEEIW